MSKKTPNWALVVVKLRWILLSLALMLTLFLGFYATKLTFNFSPDNIYLSTDPAYKFYVEKFMHEFGERANLCIIAFEGDAKNITTQKALRELHEEFEKVSDVQAVRSLVNTSIYKQHEGLMQMVPVLSDNKQDTDKMIDWVSQDKLMQNLFLSAKGDSPTLLVLLPRHLGDQEATDNVVLELNRVLEKVALKYPTLKFYLAGAPVLQQDAISTLKADQLLFIPLVALLMAVLLWLSFHSWRGVLLPFLATGTATIWTLGWLVLRGHSLDIVNNKLIVLLMVIGTSCAVQLLARFQDELAWSRRNENDKSMSQTHDHIVARMIHALAGPCLLTTTTAALGFGAVVVAKIDIIRNFGVDAAVGVMFSYFTTMLCVVPLLRILPMPKPATNRFIKFIKTKWSLDHILGIIARFSMKYANIIILTSILVTAVGLWIAKDIRADQRLAGELPENAPSVQALNFIEEHLTGIMPFDIVFEGEPSRLLEPEFIRAAAGVEEFIAQNHLNPTVRSFADVLYSFARTLSPETEQEPVSKWSDEKIGQFMLLFEMGDATLVNEARRDFISNDGRFYRIQGLLKDANTEVLGDFRHTVETKLAEVKLGGVKKHITGAAFISAEALGYMISTMINSLVVAILAIFILVLVLLRSFRFAFIVLLPNLVPIVTTVAFMQLMEITLRVATVMTFSMALGIAVDACIYLVTRFREEAILHHLRSDKTDSLMYHNIIEQTMRGSGRPVVYTTLMLLAGFSILGLSDFGAIRDFAILSTVTLATALIVDLLLWPALIIKVKPKLTFAKR